METNYVRIPFLIVILMFIIVSFTGCNFGYRINNANELKMADAIEYVVEKTAVEPISKIDINTEIADIKLIEDDNYYVEIHYYYWKDEPDYKVEDGLLSFNDSNVYPQSYSVNFDIKNYIIVYLPKDAKLDQIFLETSSGNVSLADFMTDNLNLKVSYGDLTIKDVSAVLANINLSSGTSKMKDFNIGTLEYINSYGDANFENINLGDNLLLNEDMPKSITIAMSSGHCNINKLNCNSIEIENSYGNITGTEISAEKLNSNLSSGNLELTKSFLGDGNIKNSYGDVSLFLIGNTVDYKLDLNTSYGKIEVDGKSYDGHLIRENAGTNQMVVDLSSGDVELEFE